MKAKYLRPLAALIAFAAAISVEAGVSRAQYGQTPPAQSGQPAPGAPAPGDKDKGDKGKPAPVNKAEEDAYKALYAARTGSPATQIQLGEDFVTKFPQSTI